MSLQPEAEIPTKVKARAIDLIQVWVEGYFAVDFKHNEELTEMCVRFLQEKVIVKNATEEVIYNSYIFYFFCVFQCVCIGFFFQAINL